MRILIKNGRIIDPDTRMDQVGDLLIEDDKISAVGDRLEETTDRVVDASGCYEIGRAHV